MLKKWESLRWERFEWFFFLVRSSALGSIQSLMLLVGRQYRHLACRKTCFNFLQRFLFFCHPSCPLPEALCSQLFRLSACVWHRHSPLILSFVICLELRPISLEVIIVVWLALCWLQVMSSRMWNLSSVSWCSAASVQSPLPGGR